MTTCSIENLPKQISGRRIRMVLDTDTANEIDDQFAIAYAVMSPDRLDLRACYAVPFCNANCSDPAVAMQQSFDEIRHVLKLTQAPNSINVFHGAKEYLPDSQTPVQSEAVEDLISQAKQSSSDDPLFVVAIGALTNVASAILAASDTDIVDRIVVVWIGGQPYHWPTANEFNLRGDIHAVRVVFGSGVRLVHLPAKAVVDKLRTSIPEMTQHVKGRGQIGDYLFEIFRDYRGLEKPPGWSKTIWDIANVAFLINPQWVQTQVMPSPILTPEITWQCDSARHKILTAVDVNRDEIFGDFFNKIHHYRPITS